MTGLISDAGGYPPKRASKVPFQRRSIFSIFSIFSSSTSDVFVQPFSSSLSGKEMPGVLPSKAALIASRNWPPLQIKAA